METEHQSLSAEQSLEIITKMIRQAHGNVKAGSVYLVLWGATIVIANLGMFTLLLMEYPRPYVVWLITIPAWLISIWITYSRKRRAKATSHLDRINMVLWYSYGVVVFAVVAFGFKINYQLNGLVLLISAIPAFVSGMIINFRPLIIGGILFWIFGIVCFLIGDPWQYLVGATAVTTGHLVPGLMLRNNEG